MSRQTGPFKVVEVSPTAITINEDGTVNTVSVDQAILAPPAKYAKGQLMYTPDEPVDNRQDNVHEDGEQTSAEDIARVTHDYAVNHIMSHVGKGDNVQYLLRWYTYNFVDERVEPSEHIFEHFITHNWRRLNEKGEVAKCHNSMNNITQTEHRRYRSNQHLMTTAMPKTKF